MAAKGASVGANAERSERNVERSADTCPILECKFNRSSNKPVECIACNFKACVSCIKTYILSENNIHCMSCRKEWNREFVDANFTKTFRTKELRDHREKLLLAREKAMLAETVPRIEHMHRVQEKHALIREKEAQIKRLKREIVAMNDEIFAENMAVLNPGRVAATETQQPRKIFHKPCPREGCTSLMSSRYRCIDENCNTYVCSLCDKEKAGFEDPDHVCNPDDVASVRLKSSECKKCPSCHVDTYKVDGCDQVWCPPPCGSNEGRTGTQWLFSTGTIDRSRPHAPLYYEYMRRMNNGVAPRNPGDCPGAGDQNAFDFRIIERHITRTLLATQIIVDQITDIHRHVIHVRFHEVRRFITEPIAFETHMDLRILVLENKLNENKWKKTLHKRDKARELKNAIHELLQMFVDASRDIFHTLLAYTPTIHKDRAEAIQVFFTEIHALREYYNESVQVIRNRFDSVVLYYVNKDWDRMVVMPVEK